MSEHSVNGAGERSLQLQHVNPSSQQVVGEEAKKSGRISGARCDQAISWRSRVRLPTSRLYISCTIAMSFRLPTVPLSATVVPRGVGAYTFRFPDGSSLDARVVSKVKHTNFPPVRVARKMMPTSNI